MNCENPECPKDQTFDAIVQMNPTEANIFEMFSDVTLGINRDIKGLESPTESTAEKGRDLPYVERVDCSNCGEEIVMSDKEIEKMKHLFPEKQRTYPYEILANHDTKPDFDDIFTGDQVLMMFLGQGAQSDGAKTTYIEDPNKRYKAAKKFAEEHNAQVYTEVDGDNDGEIYYSKGFRFCNRINQGLYSIVKVEGLKVDNS